jgi:hypothetical protein
MMPGGNLARPFFLTRTLAGLVFMTLLMTGAASASSFVTPEPMTAKLGPSMIALGEPASAPVVATDIQAEPAGTAEAVAAVVDEAPLEYPFPGGKVPIIRASDRIVSGTPLNYPAPAAQAEATAPPATDVTFVKVSHSIIAMAAPEPPVSFEEVAAVDQEADEETSGQPGPIGPLPTVIRGGVVDEGGAGQAAMPAEPAKKPAMAAARQAPAQHAAPQAAEGSSQALPRKPDLPIPSPTPAPPPAGIVPQAKIQ